MPSEIIRNAQRGHLDHGWLKTAHSFSFGSYMNRARMNFGALLVVNEDTIAPDGGFGEHAHDNMEIITIPLSGALEHDDSLGNGSIVRAGDVQIMSAGTGIRHSERNPSATEPVHLLQLWILPKVHSLKTRYEQMSFDASRFQNTLCEVVTPDASPDHLQIHQDVWISFGHFDAEQAIEAKRHKEGNGLFFLIIDGEVDIDGDHLDPGDAFTAWDEETVRAQTGTVSTVLLIEVPMVIA